MAASGKTDRSPHEQEIKFFAKVRTTHITTCAAVISELICELIIIPQVLLPLIDQYFKNHCLYFLSSPNKNLSSSGYASNKEKEMVTRYRSAMPALHAPHDSSFLPLLLYLNVILCLT